MIDAVVNQMDQVTQQNGAMVEQSAAARTALARQAIAVARATGPFSVGAVARQAAARRTMAPSAAKPLRVKAGATRGHTAMRPAPAPKADSREEF